MIIQHRTVMHVDNERTSEREEEVWFIVPEGGSPDLYEDLMLDWDVWCRMHKPHTITITVVPGDTLSDEADTVDNPVGLD